VENNIIHSENILGIDYFVGDLHGSYNMLMAALDQVAFDSGKDRLFAAGDLIDRGSASLECLRLVQKPWFYSVLGNHEAIFYERLQCEATARKRQQMLLHEQNGGDWAKELSAMEETECLGLIRSIPLRRTIQYRGKSIGLVHAGWRWDWSEPALSSTHAELRREYATWARLDAYGALEAVPGIDVVVSGHQNTRSVETRGNQLWLDTLLEGGYLSILTASQVLEYTISSAAE